MVACLRACLLVRESFCLLVYLYLFFSYCQFHFWSLCLLVCLHVGLSAASLRVCIFLSVCYFSASMFALCSPDVSRSTLRKFKIVCSWCATVWMTQSFILFNENSTLSHFTSEIHIGHSRDNDVWVRRTNIIYYIMASNIYIFICPNK
jgi:hypothetical protein